MIDYPHNLQRIAAAILQIFGVEAKHQKTVRITKSLFDEIMWDQDIEVFDLVCHPKAKQCFAWATLERGSETTRAILGVPPIVSATDALDAISRRKDREVEIGNNFILENGFNGTHWATLNGEPVKLAKCYRVLWRPLPDSEEARRTERCEGYFYCMADLGNPLGLLSEKLAQKQEEVIHFELDEVSAVGTLLGQGSTRSRVEQDGFALKLGHIVDRSGPKSSA